MGKKVYFVCVLRSLFWKKGAIRINVSETEHQRAFYKIKENWKTAKHDYLSFSLTWREQQIALLHAAMHLWVVGMFDQWHGVAGGCIIGSSFSDCLHDGLLPQQ